MPRPKQVIDHKKLELVRTATPLSPLQAMEDLMVFDARCLDRETWRQLLRVLPDLTRVRKAWKAHFATYGCVSCHRKNTEYGAGGFCWRCLAKHTTRMRTCFRNVAADRNLKEELASLTRKADAARMLFNGGDE